jgi:hypothetical protein
MGKSCWNYVLPPFYWLSMIQGNISFVYILYKRLENTEALYTALDIVQLSVY